MAIRGCAALLGFLVQLVNPVVGLGQELSSAEPVVLSADLKVEEIAPGIWRHVSFAELEGFGRSAANGLVVVGQGEAALIDTPWTDELTNELLDWVEQSVGSPVTTVVATHYHGDNLGGLVAAHARGAVSWAFDQTIALASESSNPVPQRGFNDRIRLEVGGRVLELWHPGGGHTIDNIVVWIEDQMVLFGGCVVRAARANALGYTEEADLEGWPQTIVAVRQAYGEARLIVPGHGSPGGMELLDRTLELLAAHPAREQGERGQ